MIGCCGGGEDGERESVERDRPLLMLSLCLLLLLLGLLVLGAGAEVGAGLKGKGTFVWNWRPRTSCCSSPSSSSPSSGDDDGAFDCLFVGRLSGVGDLLLFRFAAAPAIDCNRLSKEDGLSVTIPSHQLAGTCENKRHAANTTFYGPIQAKIRQYRQK